MPVGTPLLRQSYLSRREPNSDQRRVTRRPRESLISPSVPSATLPDRNLLLFEG